MEITPAIEQAHQAYRTGDLEGALKTLYSFVERDRTQPELLLRLAQVCFKLGRHVDAQGWFQEVSRLDPDGHGVAAREGIAECLLMGDHKRGSSEHLPGRLTFLIHCASSYAARGQAEDALRCWFRVLSLQPDHEEARRQVADSTPPENYGWVG